MRLVSVRPVFTVASKPLTLQDRYRKDSQMHSHLCQDKKCSIKHDVKVQEGDEF